jgi:hypothetical protein
VTFKAGGCARRSAAVSRWGHFESIWAFLCVMQSSEESRDDAARCAPIADAHRGADRSAKGVRSQSQAELELILLSAVVLDGMAVECAAKTLADEDEVG